MTHKILIVDDEPNIVLSLEFLLEQDGFEVAVARDGEEALAQVAAFRPDLVLLDIMLPLLNGYEVCQKIRATPGGDGVRVLMLSARGRELDVSKGMALGADGYITKPFSTRDLIEQVRRVLAA